MATRQLDRYGIMVTVYDYYCVKHHLPGCVGGTCCYHGVDQNGQERVCAIGLFDQAGALEGMNRATVDEIFDNYPGVLETMFGYRELHWEDELFVRRLQEAHDEAAINPDRFEAELHRSLETIAADFEVHAVAF